MSIFCSLIREECNTFHFQSTVKTLESASQLPYRHMQRRAYYCPNMDEMIDGDRPVIHDVAPWIQRYIIKETDSFSP